MSFSDIRLPNLVLVDFYKSSLVDLPKKQPEHQEETLEPATVATPVKYLGENLRNILILVNYPDEQHLPGEQLDFLTNILGACQLNIADTAVVNTARLGPHTDHLIKMFSPKIMLLFGEKTLTLPGNEGLEDFLITDLDGVLCVSSPGLEDLNKNNNESKLLKRKLWDCLKQLFKRDS